MEKIIWNDYQKAIFKAIRDTDKNIIIKACAGSSKTTVIKRGCTLLRANLSIGFFAFNKSIATELRNSLPKHIDVQTLHAFGYNSIKGDIDKDKLSKIINSLYDDWGIDQDEYPNYRQNIRKAVELCYNNLEFVNILDLLNYYEIEYNKDSVKHIKQVMSVKTNTIDFTDMIYLAGMDGITTKQYDVIFIDELQDLNKAQQRLIMKAVKPRTRIIAVGDENQSIYSFSGADGNAFDFFINRDNTIVLPLSISYRCSKAVVRLAKKYAHIEESEHATEGVVRNASISDITPGCFVLCRNNYPLMKLYYDLVENGIPAYIKGDNDSLINILSNYRKYDTHSTFEHLTELMKNKNEQVLDNYQTIKILLKKHSNIQECITSLKTMFEEGVDKVCLSSIHKAKGLEADRVILLEPKLLEKELDGWQVIEQRNLYYVAITRARKEFLTLFLKTEK